MSKTVTVWQVERPDCDETLIVESLSELETAFGFADDEPQAFIITCLEMAQTEYDALGDFRGFE